MLPSEPCRAGRERLSQLQADHIFPVVVEGRECRSRRMSRHQLYTRCFAKCRRHLGTAYHCRTQGRRLTDHGDALFPGKVRVGLRRDALEDFEDQHAGKPLARASREEGAKFVPSFAKPFVEDLARVASGHRSDNYIWRYVKPDAQSLADAVDDLG